MMDYQCFDPILDAVFVLDKDRFVVYSNEAAANFCESSQRRLLKSVPLYDVLTFDDDSLFVMPGGTWGENEVTPYREVNYSLKSGKRGKVQIAINPFEEVGGERRWSVILHDVTLEEVLAGKYRAELEDKEIYIAKLQATQAELEVYSQNLEKMVQERTIELEGVNRVLRAIMESLGQGFLVFGADGIVLNIFTKACLSVLETNPGGKSIIDVLQLAGPDREHFQMWLQAVFSQTLPFESLVELAPSTYEHSQGRAIHLEYYLLDPNEKAVAQIVMVATDRTLEKEAAKALEDEKQHAKMILKAFKYREQFSRFLNSLEGGISALLVQAGKRIGFDADEAFRNLHTMEGEAGAFSAHEIREACRECQDFLEPLRILDQGEDPNSLMNSYQQSVKRLAARFDQFLKDSEDIFTMLAVSGEAKIDIDRGDFCILLQELRDLGLDPKILEKYSDRYLKQSVQDMLIHYNDIVQLIAEKQGKIVAPIEFTGEDVRIYGDRYQFLFDSLVHVFRNSVDHGIEDIEIRLKEGKPETGRIVINTKLESVRGQNWIEITIADDGMGISADLLREKAKNSMPIESQVDWKDDDAVLQWIFHPGMTTRSFAGEFSGRGVGMDAVKKEVVRLGGDIRVESQLRKGTRFIMRIPEIGEALELKAIA